IGPSWSYTKPSFACSRVWSNAAAPSRPISSCRVNSSSIPACATFPERTRRMPSSICTTAALLSAPRMVPPAFRIRPSSTTGRRSGGPRLELRVDLARDEPRMIRQLDDLDEPAPLERPAHDEAGLREPLAVRVVHLVAVPVPLVNRRLAVQLARPCALGNLDR